MPWTNELLQTLVRVSALAADSSSLITLAWLPPLADDKFSGMETEIKELEASNEAMRAGLAELRSEKVGCCAAVTTEAGARRGHGDADPLLWRE